MIRRRGEWLYGVAPCTAVLQAKRRKVYGIYQKAGFLEKKPASKRQFRHFHCTLTIVSHTHTHTHTHTHPIAHRVALGDGSIRRKAEELKVDLKLVDGSTLDRLCGNRPHQVSTGCEVVRLMNVLSCVARGLCWMLLHSVSNAWTSQTANCE